ncbi:MAG: hypothetical protein ABI769_19375 [Pseudomonadota bacterium]
MIAGLLLAAAVAGGTLRSSSIEGPSREVEKEVAAIRGLAFKHRVAVRQFSKAQARAFILRELAKSPVIEDYWAVVRILGLYRGPDLGPLDEILGNLTSLAAGAYDADTDMLLQFADLDEWEQRELFVHELYHGLQDQYFDLKGYLLDMARKPGANEDEVLARQAVVEGEALYVGSIYLRLGTKDVRPMREQLADIVAAQREWSPAQWDESLRNPALTVRMRARLQQAIDARRRMPPFMLENFISSYLDGMAFIHALHEKGWPEVEKLYRLYPPESTEQILHPAKWNAHESPVVIAWPSFEPDPLFADWHLLRENVLGERQWRLVFRAQGFGLEANSAAAGWRGDRYAVFRHKGGGEFLMLMYTSWDTPDDAAEFAAAYRRLLEAKYREVPAQTRVFTQGRDVLMVEAGTNAPADAFMEFNRRGVITQP